jgi:hypothetical protein
MLVQVKYLKMIIGVGLKAELKGKQVKVLYGPAAVKGRCWKNATGKLGRLQYL